MSAILWPVRRSDLARTTDGATYVLRVTCNGVTTNLTSASIDSARNYWFSGDAQADSDGGVGGIGDLCAILQTLLRTHAQGASFVVTLSSANRINITCSFAFSILWSHASTTLGAIPFGFPQSDTVSGTSAAAPNQTRGAWCPLRPPTLDTRDRAQYVVRAAFAESGRGRIARTQSAAAKRDIRFELLLPRYGLTEYADATEPTGAAEAIWTEALSRGRAIRYYEDEAVRTALSYGLYNFRPEEAKSGDREDVVFRDRRFSYRWACNFPLRRFA